LSGDADEIIAGARQYLRRWSFAAYCDTVLMPALRLGRADYAKGQITLPQQAELRGAIVHVVEALNGAERDSLSNAKRKTVLEEVGSGRLLLQQRMLRQRTEAQAAPDAEPIVLCVGMGLPGDDLATEILVRILRGLHMDARHLTAEELHAFRYPRASASVIGAVCLVSMMGGDPSDAGVQLSRQVRSEAPDAYVMALLIPGLSEDQAQAELRATVDRMVSSYEQAVHELQARVGGATLAASTRPSRPGG
jgi:hypothetical protein